MKLKHNFVDIPELHLTAKDQERCVRDWERFLESDLDRARFTKHLYKVLIGHFDYPVLYDQEGFFLTYFGAGREDQALFFLRDIEGHFLELRRYWLWKHIQPLSDAMETALIFNEKRLEKLLRDRLAARRLRELQMMADELGFDLVKRAAQ